MTDTSELEIAYFAGFFDGEGMVAIYRKKYVVALANTDVRPLKRAQELWGGYICSQAASSRPGALRDLWRWQIYGHSARGFLEAIRPYLILKVEQVDVYLETLARVPIKGGKYGPGDREAIQGAADQLRLLKQRGVA